VSRHVKNNARFIAGSGASFDHRYNLSFFFKKMMILINKVFANNNKMILVPLAASDMV